LVEPYRVSDKSIYHIDLYRVSDEEELEYLGWSDLDDGFCIIEWPERAPGLLRQADLELRLTYQDAGRLAELSGLSGRGADVADAMEDSDSES
jgi:tRNA threonylcarbamoyladenosine biosynthesis protein TsaE